MKIVILPYDDVVILQPCSEYNMHSDTGVSSMFAHKKNAKREKMDPVLRKMNQIYSLKQYYFLELIFLVVSIKSDIFLFFTRVF